MKTPIPPPKPFFPLATLLILVACAALVPVPLTGCKSINSAAHKTVAVTDVSVTAAMGAWNVYVGAKHPGVEKELKVKAAYEAYQKAAVTLCDAAITYLNAKQNHDPTLEHWQVEFDAATQATAKALTDLVELVKSLGATL